uniref:Putative ovule protein n=1 Tax=Solanum chacoense TaxID=4108 RepID=A0A0V0GZR7_SOLCH
MRRLLWRVFLNVRLDMDVFISNYLNQRATTRYGIPLTFLDLLKPTSILSTCFLPLTYIYGC